MNERGATFTPLHLQVCGLGDGAPAVIQLGIVSKYAEVDERCAAGSSRCGSPNSTRQYHGVPYPPPSTTSTTGTTIACMGVAQVRDARGYEHLRWRGESTPPPPPHHHTNSSISSSNSNNIATITLPLPGTRYAGPLTPTVARKSGGALASNCASCSR